MKIYPTLKKRYLPGTAASVDTRIRLWIGKQPLPVTSRQILHDKLSRVVSLVAVMCEDLLFPCVVHSILGNERCCSAVATSARRLWR